MRCVTIWDMSGRIVVIVCGLLYGVLNGTAVAAPKSESLATAWRLDVKFHDPQRVTLRFPGDQHPSTFWYMLYQVTNNTGQEVGFYPSFRLVTDTLQVVVGGADIPPSVYDAITARHKGEFPFLAPPARVTGRLLQGEENARASVAVFRPFDREANSFTVYASGFSGEIQRSPNPAFDTKQKESESNPRSFILRRTLAIIYALPGAPEKRWWAKPVRRTREWVMR